MFRSVNVLKYVKMSKNTPILPLLMAKEDTSYEWDYLT